MQELSTQMFYFCHIKTFCWHECLEHLMKLAHITLFVFVLDNMVLAPVVSSETIERELMSTDIQGYIDKSDLTLNKYVLFVHILIKIDANRCL